MKTLSAALKKNPVVYVTRDIERALGLPLHTSDYYIIANSSPFAMPLARKKKNVLLIKGKKKLDTRELLNNPKTAVFIKKIGSASIVVFKNTLQIENVCATHGWSLLNPPAAIASQ